MNNSTNNQQNTPVDKAKWATYMKQYRLDNKDKLTVYDKQHYLNNKAKIAVYSKQYCFNKKSEIAVRQKRYRLINKAKLAVQSKQYHQRRYQTDLIYKAKHALRAAVNHAFKRIGKNKPARTEQLLGCTWLEAKAHFERLFHEGMSWENHGAWHIDHIRPVASFKADEFHLMNHISNLQPLWAEENLGSKRVSDAIKWEL